MKKSGKSQELHMYRTVKIMKAAGLQNGIESQEIHSYSEVGNHVICIYERNQSGCEKAKKVEFLPPILCVFLTICIFFCFDENCHVILGS